MLWLGTPSSPDIRQAMSDGLIGCMTTPSQGNLLPSGAKWAADNGKFGKGWPGADAWFSWLARKAEANPVRDCLWALAPDVPFDSGATLAESRPWLARIRKLGLPAAFAAQDGCEHGQLPRWREFDVLFLAGSTEWKLSPVAAELTRQAHLEGLAVHMGRVNTRTRLMIAEWFGCDTADGTTLSWGPDRNWPQLAGWLARMHREPCMALSEKAT